MSMKFPYRRILAFGLLIAVLLVPSHVPAQEPSQADQAPAVQPESPDKMPDLADIVPLTAELTGRLAALERKLKDQPDISEAESKYKEIQANLKEHADELQRVKALEGSKYNKLVGLKDAIKREEQLFGKISKPIRQSISELGGLREEWLSEKKRWNKWHSFLVKEKGLDQLESAFEDANETIDTALNLVLPQLDLMLTVQENAGLIDKRLRVLTIELDGLIVEERRSALRDTSSPMASMQFVSQFRSSKLWHQIREGLNEVSWPGSGFFARQGWIVLLQGLLSLSVIIGLYRNRDVLNQSRRWCFLAARYVSAGLFLGFMTTLVIYQYQGVPVLWRVGNMIVAGISFIRLIGALIEASWKRHFVYGLVFVLIVTRILEALNFPLPFFRLYIVLTSLAGIFFCLRWAKESLYRKDSSFYTWSLRSASLFFAVIIIVQLWWKRAAASHLFVSLMHSIATVLVFMLFLYIIHGGLEWLFRASFLRRAPDLHKDADIAYRRVARFLDIAVGGLVLLPIILMIWGAYDTLEEALKGLLAFGFNVGSQRISVALLLVAAGFVYGAFLVSWIFQNLLMDEMLFRRGLGRGVRFSIRRLVHYVFLLVGFLLAIVTLGFDITKLTIVLSALGIGIGFGLQGVVNNFISGLILLFERPVREGDYIEFAGNWAEIKNIGLRATTVQTFDQADVIIPNADLVTNPVTNWTLSNRKVRLIIPVGVAHGSDIPLVIETLTACADAHSMVAETPAPQVLFVHLGENSLEFELRVWALDADEMLNVKSELYQEIDRRFREAKIEIAFPQLDLHLRSMSESATLRPLKAT
jgi:small-conductance mechanosensitive channel